MTSFLALAVLLPTAVPQETELGTIVFPAGPARGSARFYLASTEPRVDVTIHNDTPGPIWWRGGEMAPDWKFHRSEWQLQGWAAAAGKVGKREGELAQEPWAAHRTPEGFAPWEWERWVMVPRRAAPAHAHDYELARLRVTWDDEAGLDSSVVAVEPR